MTAEDLIRMLELAPLPVEGGFFRETYRSRLTTAIYYLLTPTTCSLMHRLVADEVYHFYLGDPVELLVLDAASASEVVTLGTELERGMHVQRVVRAGVWQGSRLRAGGRFALLGTTVAPPFDPRGFELGVRGALVDAFPAHAELIRALTPG